MAKSYGSVDAARRKTATRKSTRKPKGGKSPSAKRKRVGRAGAKAAPGYASERYGPSTKRKSTRKPGGSAKADGSRRKKAANKAAGKSAPSYIKTKPNVKKPNEHKNRKPKASKGASKPNEHKGRKPKRVGKKPNEHASRRPKPRNEHINRKPKKPSRNVAHGDYAGVQQGAHKAFGINLNKAISKAAAHKISPKKIAKKVPRGRN